MLEKKYNTSMACGAICAGGTLGILIPPSVMIIIYGPIARISVGKLFLGTLVPGLLLTFLYMLYIGIRCYLNPQDGPPMPREERQVSFKGKLRILFTSVIPPALIIFSVLGSIFFGIAAVTEAAAVGAAASIDPCRRIWPSEHGRGPGGVSADPDHHLHDHDDCHWCKLFFHGVCGHWRR